MYVKNQLQLVFKQFWTGLLKDWLQPVATSSVASCQLPDFLEKDWTGMDFETLPTHVLTEEIKKINIKLMELQIAHEQLALRVENNESMSQSKSASAAKNILNQHPKLKPILHKKVLEMCGIDMLGQADCLKTLAQYQHGLPNQWPSEEVDGQIIWRPAWSEHVDHTVNIRFLHSIMDGIMEDEKMKHSQAKGELDNNDYVSTTIMMMAKSYW
ncbi:hypothetical protein EDC04DRAFT_2892509 [Pisolithus marmoratus]|nr:hypothetical protein EDC04DRAFT_2892509 [Pisolithus marmoratus]